MEVPKEFEDLEMLLEKYMESMALMDMYELKKEIRYSSYFLDIDKLHHYYNPAHVYCRMIRNGYKKEEADKFCKMYETNIRGVLYGKDRV